MNEQGLPKCSVIIPTLNEEQNIERCLQSLIKQDYPRSKLEIIVVDNGSTDSTRTIAKGLADIVDTALDCNVGEVRNVGAKLSSGDILVCTDADCTFSEDWISTGVALLKAHENSVFGGGLKGANDQNWVERLWLLNPKGETIQQKDLMGSCIFIKKADFRLLGGFPADITSGEDTSLSTKAKNLGYKVILERKLSVCHLGTPKTLKDFTARQAWHGENYIHSLSKSFQDKIFWLIIAYMLSAIGVIVNISTPAAFFFFALNQICPITLTVKRLKRAKYLPRVIDIPYLLALDNSYLIGRSLGLIRGIKLFYQSPQR